MNTAERLKMLRENKKLSQEEVAKLIGVDRTTINKYESGSSKPTRKLQELAKLFDVPIDYILCNMTHSNNPQAQLYKEKTINEPKDLKKFLDQTEIMFDGEIYNLTPEEKEMVMQSLKVAFYAAKRANKRKKDALKK